MIAEPTDDPPALTTFSDTPVSCTSVVVNDVAPLLLVFYFATYEM